MEEMLKALMKKKKSDHDMSDHEKKAKMGVLHQIHKMATDAMGDDIKGMKKVTVASNDDQGLQEGLANAKSLLSAKHPNRDDDADAEGVSHDMRPGKRHVVDNKDEVSDEEPETNDENHSRGFHKMAPKEMNQDDEDKQTYAQGGVVHKEGGQYDERGQRIAFANGGVVHKQGGEYDNRGGRVADEGVFNPNAHQGPHGGPYAEHDPAGDEHGTPDETTDDLGDMHDDEISAMIDMLNGKLAKRRK